jgi:hypothetical protein
MLTEFRSYDTKNKILMLAGVLIIAFCLMGFTVRGYEHLKELEKQRQAKITMQVRERATTKITTLNDGAETIMVRLNREERERKEREEAERLAREQAEREEVERQAQLQAYYSTYSSPSYSYSNTGGLTKSGGVNYYNGRRETWYSSRTLHHYRTSEWTVGSDGVYRDSDGYVVVACSDKAQGSEVDTSKGKGKIYDSGCAAGTTDIYTAW